MIDITQFAQRIRRRMIAAGVLFFGGAMMMVVDFTTTLPTMEKGEFAAVWAFLMGVGLFFYYRSMELPRKEILQLAENKNGLLTLSEISTALAIDPKLAPQTLIHLQRMGMAVPRWEELHKNLWEFPDYVKLPFTETIDMARKKGGRVSMQDLVAGGHSPEVARQTFDALSEKGLGTESGNELVVEAPRAAERA